MTDLLYTTGELAEVVNEMEKPVLHLRDRYFTRFTYAKGRKVFFDVVDGRPRIAPYVHPRLPGKIIEKRGFTTDSVEPPYVKPKHAFEPDDFLDRLPGEVFLGDKSPAERRDLAIQACMQEHDEMLGVREEAQAAEVLRTGKITLAGEGYPTKLLDFGRDPALTIVLSGGARWQTGGIRVLDQLESWALLAKRKSKGVTVTEVTFDPGAWTDFRKNLTVDDVRILNMTNGGAGLDVDLGPRDPQKAQYMGRLGAFDLFVYYDTYEDEEGVEVELMPDRQVILTGPGLMGTRCYGAIRDARALRDLGSAYVQTRMYSKNYIEEDPGVEYVLSQSAPLMVPFRKNASVGVRV